MARTSEDRLAEVLWQLGAETNEMLELLRRIESKLDARLDRLERRIENLELAEATGNGQAE